MVVSTADVFGLTANPFSQASLNCLLQATDHDRLRSPRSYVGDLTRARELVRGAERDKSHCFILVSGPAGSGRSSLANCLLDEYRRCRQIADRELYIVPTYASRSWPADETEVISSCLTTIYRRCVKKRLVPGGNGAEDHVTAAFSTLQADPLKTPIPTLGNALQTIALALGVRHQRAGFGILLEGMTVPGHVKQWLKLIQDVETICVITTSNETRAGDRVEREFDDTVAKPEHGVAVKLQTVAGDEVLELVDALWRAAAPGHDFPLHERAVREWFSENPRSVGRALYLVKRVYSIFIGRYLAPAALPAGAPPKMSYEETRYQLDEESQYWKPELPE